MTVLPPIRSKDIIEQILGEETLLYDLNNNKAFSLNKTASIIYKYCDGKTKIDEIERYESLPKDTILLALKQLGAENLIDLNEVTQTEIDKISRREVAKKLGIGGLALLPVISIIVAPTALQAASTLLVPNAICTTPPDCQSNICNPTFLPGIPFCISPPGLPPTCIPTGGPPGPPICG